MFKIGPEVSQWLTETRDDVTGQNIFEAVESLMAATNNGAPTTVVTPVVTPVAIENATVATPVVETPAEAVVAPVAETTVPAVESAPATEPAPNPLAAVAAILETTVPPQS